MNGQVLHWGLLQNREPVRAETRVSNELAEVWGDFWKVTEEGLLRWSWVHGSEEIWKPSLSIPLRQ